MHCCAMIAVVEILCVIDLCTLQIHALYIVTEEIQADLPIFFLSPPYLMVVSAHLRYSPIQWIQQCPAEILSCPATASSCAPMFSVMSSRGPPALPGSAGGPLDEEQISLPSPSVLE